jgi:hypothetical protein
MSRFAASGWTTPSKRKGDEEASKPLSAGKKQKTLKPSKAVEASSSPVRSSPRRAPHRAAPETPVETPKVEETTKVEDSSEEKPQANVESESKQAVFDDYFVSGVTSVFITADDLIHMLDDSKETPLWKATASFAQSDREARERIDHWLVPANEEASIQNVGAFREAFNELLEEEKRQKEARSETEKSGKKVDGEGAKGGADGMKAEDGVSKPREGTGTWWYHISVSRNMSKGALAVKLIKGTVRSMDGVVPLGGAREEEGNFWLSDLKPASEKDAESLDEVVEQLF